MANTKKTTTTSTKTEKTSKEDKTLEKRLAEQEKLISELLQKIEQLSTSDEPMKTKPSTKKNIKFINMTTGGFSLKGSRMYHLEEQFDSKSFSESEAKLIVNNMPKSITSGKIYIVADDEFIADCELGDIYAEILSANDLKNVLNNSAEKVCKIYGKACDEQKAIIIDMIYKARLAGEEVDANILSKLGKICGKDLLGIEPLEDNE